ncbi:MAG: glycosyltransferase family 1 protein [Microcoleus sp.]
MLRVVYDHQVFSWQRYGGVSRYIYELASHLSEMEDVDVKILAFIYVNEYIKKSQPGLVTGFPVPFIASGQFHKNLARLNNAISQVWLNTKEPDIVHKTYYNQSYIPKKAKVVVTVYDMIHEKLSQFFEHKDIFNKLDQTTQLKMKSVQQADGIICISENTKKDLIEILEVEPNKISVIYLGFSPNEWPKIENSVAIAYQPFIFYVGERGGYKNFEGCLQAYASSSQLKDNFNLLCFGGGKFTQQELDLIDTLALSKNKIFQVSGDDAALADYYRHASVFIYPSLYEGFGIPLLEAMSLQCPIACSNTSSMPEVVGEAAQLFDPSQPESIAEALEKILFCSEISENLIELGRQRIKQFSWEACAEQTKQLYLSLIGADINLI